MADTKEVSPTRPNRRPWPRVLAWTFGVLIVLLVIAYFTATSSAFLKGVILPRVSRSLNADVTVSSASIHPFRQVILRDLKVQAKGGEPLVTAPEVRASYHLLDILRGNLHVDEIVLVSPIVQLIEYPDGTRNRAAPTEKTEKPSGPKEPSKESKPARMDVRKVTLENGTVRQIKNYAGNRRDVIELTNVNVTLDNLKNGATGKLLLSASLKMENNPPPPTEGGRLLGGLKGSFDFTPTSDLKSGSIQGSARLQVSRAEGVFDELADVSSDLKCDITPTNIREVALQFQKAGAALGELRASGPFDITKTEGRVRVELLALDKRVLNLAGAKSGIDFGSTTINSTNEIQFTNGGSLITAAGRFDAAKLQLTRANQTTPTVEMGAEYNVTVNRAQSNALLRAFTVTGTQNGRPLLRGELTSPMTLAWGQAANTVGDSALNLIVTNLNLADWKPFLGDSAPGGKAGLRAHLVSQQSGQQLTFELDSQIAGLTVTNGGSALTPADLTLRARGQTADLKQFTLTEYTLQVAQQNQPAIVVSGSGTYDRASADADVQVNGRVTLSKLFPLLAQPDLTASNGIVELKAHVVQKQQTQTITGNLTLADFTGQSGRSQFRNFGLVLDLDLSKTSEQLQLRNVTGKLSEGGNDGGGFTLSGTHSLTNKSAQFTVKLSDLNQNGLRAFLEPLLADKKLIALRLNGTTFARYDPNGDSAVKADVQLANFVVRDPKQDVPAMPLEAKVQVDTAINKRVADVRQFLITLSPTDRAKNQIDLQGRLDLSQTNALQGNLKLTAESLDLTRYYDLFAGQKEEKKKDRTKPQSKATDTAAAAVVEQQEPEAKQLPVKTLTVEASIGQLYLREVAITRFQTTAKIEGSHVVLNPCQLVLNDAPMKAMVDLDLGVTGYRYALEFNADRVQLAPLANSFAPDYKDRAKGELIANANFKGQGVTGASMQKNLSGQANLVFTNANIKLSGRVLRPIITVIAVALRIPELAESPVNWAVADLDVSDGKINLKQVHAAGTAFAASSQGVIPIAPVLSNSPLQHLPVHFALSRPIAERGSINLSAADTNSAYADLGVIAHVDGTLGKPDPKPDYVRIALLTGQQFIPGAAGQILRGFTGSSGSNSSNGGGLFPNLGGILKGRGPDTNNPAPDATINPNAPAGTNQNGSPVNNFLKGILGPKKE